MDRPSGKTRGVVDVPVWILSGPLAAEEILEAFARMAGGEPGGARLFFIVVALAPAHAYLLVQQALQALHHASVVLGDHLPDLDARVEQTRRGNDLIEEPDALSLLGIDDPAGVEQLLRLRQTNQ